MKKLFLSLFLLTAFFPAFSRNRDELSQTRAAARPAGSGVEIGIAQRLFDFDHLTVLDGLSQNSVFSILQDHQGFLWFGTLDGLNRYDGYGFRTFYFDPASPQSLTDNTINRIWEDRDRQLWIGTARGLTRFDPDKESFQRFQNHPEDPGSLSHDHIRSIYEDSHGRLWIGTWEGLNLYLPETQSFLRYAVRTGEAGGPGSSVINAIHEAGDGRLLIGTPGGLELFEWETRSFLRPTGDESGEVNAIFTDSRGRIWLGADAGAFLIDMKTLSVGRAPFPPGAEISSISQIIEDKQGNIWFGTMGNSLHVLSPQGSEVFHFPVDPQNPRSLSDVVITSLYLDHGGLVWIGTSGRGLNIWNPIRRKFRLIRRTPNDPASITSTSIRAILEDRRGSLWIGGYGGLNQFDIDRGLIRSYVTGSDPGMLGSNNVYALLEDPSRPGEIWVGLEMGGLNRFHTATGRFTRYAMYPDNPEGLRGSFVKALAADGRGGLWVGTDEGFHHFDPENMRFRFWESGTGPPHHLSDRTVSVIHQDRGGIVWIGTRLGGLSRFDPDTERFFVFRHNPSNDQSLSSDHVQCILEDRDGILWIGTGGGGFNRLDRETERFTRFGIHEGLPNNTVYGILEDNRRNLWISTNRGLSRFNPADGVFINYTPEDGLQNFEFNAGSYFQSDSGMMYFGGISGLNVFRPDDMGQSEYRPPVVFTDLKISNRSVSIGERINNRIILTEPISRAESIALSYRNRAISFEFSSLDFASPRKNRYRYILEGIDTAWNDIGHQRAAGYARIPSGRYVFRVKGTNSDGVWNEEPASLSILVIPPFWKTLGFQILLGLAVIFGVFSGHRLRTRAIEKKNRHLEEMNLRLNLQIRQREEAEKVQAASYDIARSALTAPSLETLFSSIHESIGRLMPAKNFYIALHDPSEDLITFPYFRDERDTVPEPKKPGRGLTEYVLRTGEPLLASPEVFESLCRSGDVVSIGAPSIDWLGVPLRARDKVIGVMSVQSYDENLRYGPKERDILLFVSTQVAMALERSLAETQIKRDLHDKEILLKEIHHRVKNNMQIISSLLNLQAPYAKDGRDLELLRNCRNRIRSMALVHDNLYRSKNFSRVEMASYFQRLAQDLYQSYGDRDRNIAWELEVKDVSIGVDLAVPCGLIVNELVANALKHAFPAPHRTGRIRIAFQDIDAQTLELRVSDDGIGIPDGIDPSRTDSLGLQLVYLLAESQLQGTIRLDKERGTSFVIRFKRK